MKLKNISRTLLYAVLVIISGLILLIYWLDYNPLKIDSIKFGPIQIESLNLSVSKGFESERLRITLGDLDIAISQVSVSWQKWWFLLGNIDSVICNEVKFNMPESSHNNLKKNNDKQSLMGLSLIKRLNIQFIKIVKLRSIDSAFEADSIEASLSGSQLQIDGSKFRMRSNEKVLLHAPKFRGKFHFPTNRLILEKFELHNDQIGNLSIKDLNLPISMKPGVTITCRELYLNKIDQTLTDFQLDWKNNKSYQSRFKLLKVGELEVFNLILSENLNLNALKFKANKFKLNLDLQWLDRLLDKRLSKFLSVLPNPLATGEFFPHCDTDQIMGVEIHGSAHLQKDYNLQNDINLTTSLYWSNTDNTESTIFSHIEHKPGQTDYQIIPLRLSISKNKQDIWRSTLSGTIAYSDSRLLFNRLQLDKIQWQNKFSAFNINTRDFSIDKKLNMYGSLNTGSIYLHKILTSGPSNIELRGALDNIKAKINVKNLIVKDFGKAESTKLTAHFDGDQLKLQFDLQNYSKLKSYSSEASGSMTWSPQFSEGFIQIKTGSLRLVDYLNFDSRDDSGVTSSNSAYRWTIEGQTAISDEQVQGLGNFSLIFDHRLEGPSGFAELKSAIFKLAGNKFTLIEPAHLKLFPKPREKFKDELLWSANSQYQSQTLTEQLQTMWNASNPHNDKFYDYGIWIHLLAGVKFRGEDLEVKISGKYPQLKFRLTSLSGRSDEELRNSFLGSLQNKLDGQEIASPGPTNDYKSGANLLVNTMIDSFFGSIFNDFGTQFHTQIGSSEQNSVGIRQPLGENVSVGITQGKQGNIQTKSKNFELQFQPGSSLKIENIEKEGYQNETQVEIQKRFRF